MPRPPRVHGQPGAPALPPPMTSIAAARRDGRLPPSGPSSGLAGRPGGGVLPAGGPVGSVPSSSKAVGARPPSLGARGAPTGARLHARPLTGVCCWRARGIEGMLELYACDARTALRQRLACRRVARGRNAESLDRILTSES